MHSVTKIIDTLSRDDVVEMVVVGCGMVDGVTLSKYSLEHPFRTLFDAFLKGTSWYSCVRLMRYFGYPRGLQFLIPIASIASVVYLKRQEIIGLQKKKTKGTTRAVRDLAFSQPNEADVPSAAATHSEYEPYTPVE